MVLKCNLSVDKSIFHKIAPKMEPLIWNKPPIWNTYAADRVVFHIGGFTVVVTVNKCSKRLESCFSSKRSTTKPTNSHGGPSTNHLVKFLGIFDHSPAPLRGDFY